MLRKIYFPLFLLCSAAVFALWVNNSQPDLKYITREPSYPQLWKRVDSCEKKGLTESAMKVVQEIYAKAKSENNAEQTVKAVIHRMKFTQYKQEFAQEKNIAELQKEVASSTFPVQPVLQSLLGDAYWQYYQNNRWKFLNRSVTVNFKKEDVSTYSLKDLLNACVHSYKSSVSNIKLAQETKIGIFDEVIIPGSAVTRNWRPSLYDFLAHRALNFFKNSEADVTKADNQFSYNQAEFLKPYPDFLAYTLPRSQDSLDFRYYSLLLFQDLGKFQVKSNNSEGLADLELERIQFIYQNSRHPSKDSIYLRSIAWLSKHFEKSSRISEILFLKAEFEFSKSSEYHPLRDSTNKWRRKNANDICRKIVQNYPKSRGRSWLKNLLNQIEAKSVMLTAEKVNDPLADSRILVKYRNVPKLYFKLVKINFFDYQLLSYKFYSKDIYKRFLDLPLVQQFEQTLPNDGDLNEHGTEIKLKAPEYGYYILLASLSKDFNFKNNLLTHQLYTVSDLAYLNHRKKGGGNEFYTVNRLSGQPVAGVKAQIWFINYNDRSRDWYYSKGNAYESNAQGYFEIEVQEQQYRNYFIEFSKDKDLLYSNDNFMLSSYHEPAEREQHTSHIFTDRAIYRPGQTVYFQIHSYQR